MSIHNDLPSPGLDSEEPEVQDEDDIPASGNEAREDEDRQPAEREPDRP